MEHTLDFKKTTIILKLNRLKYLKSTILSCKVISAIEYQSLRQRLNSYRILGFFLIRISNMKFTFLSQLLPDWSIFVK